MSLLLLLLIGLLFGGRADAPSLATPLHAPAIQLTHGPYLGAVGEEEARVWLRTAAPAAVELELTGADGQLVARHAGRPSAERDHTHVFELDGLSAATSYSYRLHIAEEAHGPFPLRTASSGPVRMIFGSCVDERRFPDAEVWSHIEARQPDVFVLLGDTPYIDSTEIAVQRTRYRSLYAEPGLARLMSSTPTLATWDDHDFGRNDTDGTLADKAGARRAFLEYHANPSYGEDGAGVYTRHRRGALELFLLDTRWFAATEPSPADPEQPSLLGRAQWEWLRAALRESDAPFKLLASGMVWNGAVRPGKSDHWAAYAHERDALFAFLGEEQVGGVVLLGGDIHRSRVLRHDTRASAGYELVELITSPLANFVIPTANQPHPGLLYDLGETQSFLELETSRDGEQHVLDARLHVGAEVRYELRLSASELRAN